MGLTREQILEKGKRKPRVIGVESPAVVEYLGEATFVRVMAGTDRDSWEEGNYRLVGKEVKFQMTNTRARLVVRCLCDADGKRLLTDADAGAVGQFDAAILDILYDAARDLNGLTPASEEALRKNSVNGQSAVSGSVSPAISE